MPPTRTAADQQELDRLETRDWLASLDDVLARRGRTRVRELMQDLQIAAQRHGVTLPVTAQTPYVNTISVDDEPAYPGDRDIERRIRNLIRWNAMAMVVRGNRHHAGIGGHISTYASIATLYEVGFHHFFRARDHECGGDHIYFQGHASPGNYARAYLEGRLSEKQMEHFRLELRPGGGLPSYPHPWLMKDFWEFPTVSMGLGPIQAIYRARFMKYLENRGLKEPTDAKVWCFVGDGECDEPETLAALSLAAREKLDNLVIVINCNLQRLDGPVRGNGKIIQELEAAFNGMGWKVIKAIWGGAWDPLFARDETGILLRRLGAMVDGEYQRFRVEDGSYIREHFFNTEEQLAALVEDMSDDELWRLNLGGHDSDKIYAAYHAAVDDPDGPAVVLAKTIKGYGLGEAGEGRNITHQQKKLNEDELLAFRDRFDIPISDEDVGEAPFHRPDDGSDEIQYLMARRKSLGGFLPQRRTVSCGVMVPGNDLWEEFTAGSDDREVATTMALVSMLGRLLSDEEIGPRIVPIIPDEARTFGMDALFRRAGIYASEGQKYEPVDVNNLLYYREAKDGQILEEGITEAGSMSSFIAAGTAHACDGLCTIPFFFFYSMFGLQRVGDLVWAAGDSRARGFLIGATAGRTTLNGEGLQHQDGHSHLSAMAIPNLQAYDPAFAYEVAIILKDGLRRMYRDDEDIFYYLTAYNEPYRQPPMPAGVEEGIVKGMYCFRDTLDGRKPRVRLMGSGPLIHEAVKAQETLAEKFDIPADVISATSYKRLREDALECQRWNMLHPASNPRQPYVSEFFSAGRSAGEAVFVAVSDYMKALPDSISRWLPGPLHSLGTDGYGRSETRESLRDFFEIDERYIVIAALHALAERDQFDRAEVDRAVKDLEIDADKLSPMAS